MSCCISWLACDVEVSRGRMRRGCRGKSLAVARQHCILASPSESLHSGLARKGKTEGWKTIQRWLDLLFCKAWLYCGGCRKCVAASEVEAIWWNRIAFDYWPSMYSFSATGSCGWLALSRSLCFGSYYDVGPGSCKSATQAVLPCFQSKWK